MEIIVASLLSGKVIMWQVILGAVQGAGRLLGGKIGVVIAFILVALWTITKTYNGLLVLQLIIQGIIAFFLFVSADD
jgi:hypothetical protein|tara:strand:- start:642 stop:872 length:231 start_codon:yes stop_codon:yes gene_type:complete